MKTSKIPLNFLNQVQNYKNISFNEFLYLFSNLKLDKLKELTPFVKSYSFTAFFKFLENRDKDFFKNISEKAKTNNYKLLSLFVFDKLHYCKNCGKACERDYCSSKCSNSSNEVKKKKEQIVLLKYGVKNVMQDKNIKDKAKHTQLSKYGDFYFKTDDFKKKSKQTRLVKYGNEKYVNIEKCKQTSLKKYGETHYLKTNDGKEKLKRNVKNKYGVENVSQLESVKLKSKQTSLEKYGCNYPMQCQKIQDKAKQTCLNKYGYIYAIGNIDIQNKAKQTCLNKYGVDYFIKSDEFLKKSKQTCLNKYGVENTNQRHITNYNDLNYNFIKNHFIDKNSEFLIYDMTKYFNLSISHSYKVKKEFGFENYQTNITSKSRMEQELFNIIPCDNKIQNDRTIINPLELDIVLPEIKLAIEYDGIYWHSDIHKDKNYHLDKTMKCKLKGYQLFHIFETDDIDIWKSMIRNKLHLNTRIYARKCIIKELKYSEVKNFLDENHIQGSNVSRINLGLFYNSELVQVMTFSKPRFNSNYEYELIRLCSKKYINVIGGATKLFKYFLKTYNPKSIISYANLRFSNGSIYETLGFKILRQTEPNYFYFKNGILESRNKYQKHKLKNLLEHFDQNKTEYENMNDNGFLRIFDCGNLVYEFKKNLIYTK